MNLKNYVISGLIVNKNRFHQYLCLGRQLREGAKGRGRKGPSWSRRTPEGESVKPKGFTDCEKNQKKLMIFFDERKVRG